MRLSNICRYTGGALSVILTLTSACGSEADPTETASTGVSSGSVAAVPVGVPSSEVFVMSSARPTTSSTTPTTGGVPSSASQACGVSQSSLTAVPSVIELIVDTSKSMNDDPNPNDDNKDSKWVITQRALQNLIPSLSDDLRLGLAFYPGTSDVGSMCFQKRQAAEIAALGSTGSLMRSSLNTEISKAHPDGGTPTEDAYRFGVEKLLATGSDANKYLVLITDGIPTFEAGCKNFNFGGVNTAPLIAAVKDAASKGVRTYVIGSPGSENARTSLSQMASVGGTAVANCNDQGPNYCHFDMTQNGDLGAGLSAALGSISSEVSSCEYRIPTDQPNLDRSKVNVLLKVGSSDEAVGRDASDTDCTQGWQYSGDGKTVQLCGDTCERVKANSSIQVQVLFGCMTTRQPNPTLN